MTAPAERLLAAANLLDKRAANATAGPWRTDCLGVWSEADVEDGVVFTDSGRAILEDCAYIATMHPEVGKALATALRVEGGTVAGWAPETAESHAALLLPIADLLLAGAS